VWPGYSKIEAKEDYDSERHRIERFWRAEFAADRKVALSVLTPDYREVVDSAEDDQYK
jgi:hypothetical protein